jgi:hypothetical protein
MLGVRRCRQQTDTGREHQCPGKHQSRSGPAIGPQQGRGHQDDRRQWHEQHPRHDSDAP